MNQIVTKNLMNEAINASRPQISDIQAPAELRELQGWLIWRLEPDANNPNGKPLKVPYYADGGKRHGKQGGINDRGRMTTFAAARDAAARRGFTGVGLALMPEFGITALDFDNCVDAQGKLPPVVRDIASQTYAEYSPSGKGIRAFVRGSYGNHKSPTVGNDYGFEVFSSNGFVTFTGNAMLYTDLLGLEDTVADLDHLVAPLCAARLTTSQRVSDSDDFMIGREPRVGLSTTQMEELLAVLDPDMPREDWIKVGMALHHECEGDDTGFDIWNDWSEKGVKYPSEENLRGQWESFDRRKGSGQRQVTMASVMRMAQDSAMLSKGEWPSPSPLPDGLLPVPPLTEDMLPQELAPWLIDISERMSVPLDFVAIPAMVMLGALIGKKVVVRPEEFTDWSEPANLWGAIVASPGAMKTPVVGQVLAPIKKFEAAAQTMNKAALEKHSLDLLFQKSAQDSALTAVKKKPVPQSAAEFEKALMECAVQPPKPKLKRFLTTDATVEKLGEICADNPNGILYHRDELPTLFLELQREEKAAVRGFLLTGWAGMEAYTFDRIGRGTTHIEAVNISLFGTAQPQRIMNLVSVSSAKHDDGMIQRLQLVAWPEFGGAWVPVDRVPDVAARETAFACCERLSELTAVAVDAENDGTAIAPFLRFNAEARDAFKVYRIELEAKVRSRSLPEPLAAHLAKYRGMVPRLALILHLAGGGSGRITAEAVRVAIKWANYLEAHARRMYACVDVLISDTAGLILRRIQARELNDGFSQRDITQKGWSGLRDASSVEKALMTLQDHGWLKLIEIPTKGRPKEIFRINPAALPSTMRE